MIVWQVSLHHLCQNNIFKYVTIQFFLFSNMIFHYLFLSIYFNALPTQTLTILLYKFSLHTKKLHIHIGCKFIFNKKGQPLYKNILYSIHTGRKEEMKCCTFHIILVSIQCLADKPCTVPETRIVVLSLSRVFVSTQYRYMYVLQHIQLNIIMWHDTTEVEWYIKDTGTHILSNLI